MNPGDMRYRVTIQQRTESRSSSGAVSNVWEEVATVWAAIQPLKGRELFAAQQINGEVTGKVLIRYRSGLTPNMRLLFNSRDGARVFDILAVINPNERNRELELMVKEVIGHGWI